MADLFPAEPAKTLPKSIEQALAVLLGTGRDKPDPRHPFLGSRPRVLLRGQDDRRQCHRDAEKSEQAAASHALTSSAPESTIRGHPHCRVSLQKSICIHGRTGRDLSTGTTGSTRQTDSVPASRLSSELVLGRS